MSWKAFVRKILGKKKGLEKIAVEDGLTFLRSFRFILDVPNSNIGHFIESVNVTKKGISSQYELKVKVYNVVHKSYNIGDLTKAKEFTLRHYDGSGNELCNTKFVNVQLMGHGYSCDYKSSDALISEFVFLANEV